MQVLEFKAMNTSVLLAAEDGEGAPVRLRGARAFILDMERRFSRFVPESELCTLNRSSGNWTGVSPALLEVISLSRQYYEDTHGLFDPSVLPDLVRTGYDRSMEEIWAMQDIVESPSSADRATVPPRPEARGGARSRFSELRVDASAGQVMLPPGLELDLGGIAKGWIVERAAKMLASSAHPAAVNAGGDIFFAGDASEGSMWTVELEDPRDASATLTTVHVDGGAVVTSSRTKRTWRRAGQLRHHIIDPRTAEPANTSWLSVTTVAPSAAIGEAYGKAVLIGGPAEARRLEIENVELAFVAVDSDGRVYGSQNARQYLNGDVLLDDYPEN